MGVEGVPHPLTRIGFRIFRGCYMKGFAANSSPIRHRGLAWPRSAVSIALVAALTLLTGCHTDPNVKKQKYLESGQRYSAQGKHREAAIQFANALKVDKNFAEAHYELAKSWLHLGQVGRGYAELSRTVDLQPANHAARLDLGGMLLAAGKLDEAKAQADAVLAAAPDNPGAHALLSGVASRKGHRDQAFSEIQRALQLDPRRATFHEQLALLSLGDEPGGASAEAELKTAASLEPKSANPRLLLAAFYAGRNRLVDAEQAARDAVASDPKSLPARESLAQIYLRQGDQAKAEATLRQASIDIPGDPMAIRALADHYDRSGQAEKASREFESIALKHPKNLDLQEDYVQSLLEVKDFRRAKTVIAGLMQKHNKDQKLLALNGIVLLNGGEIDTALSNLQNAYKDYPKDAFILFWLAKAAQAKGNLALAEKSFREVVSLNPSSLQARQELATIALQKGDVDLLSDVAEKTIASVPGFSNAYVWRASVELVRNAVEKAEVDLKTALTLAPTNAAAYLQLGKLRFSQKRYQEGVKLLEQALQYDPDSVQALRLLMSYDLIQKHPDAALSRVNQQIAKRPANSSFYVLLAEYEIQVKNLDQALAAAEKAFQLNSNEGQAVMLIARIQIQKGQTASAIAAWQQWSHTHPRDAAALAILGILEESTGNQGKAEEYYKNSLQIQPEQPVAANNLAYLMLTKGEDLDVALTLAQTARRGMPNSPNTADTLAWAYYHKQTYAFARDLLEEAAKTDAASQAIHYHLGMVYRGLRDKVNAANHLRKAIALGPNTSTAKDARTALKGVG